jgi:hypothetical protein
LGVTYRWQRGTSSHKKLNSVDVYSVQSDCCLEVHCLLLSISDEVQ